MLWQSFWCPCSARVQAAQCFPLILHLEFFLWEPINRVDTSSTSVTSAVIRSPDFPENVGQCAVTEIWGVSFFCAHFVLGRLFLIVCLNQLNWFSANCPGVSSAVLRIWTTLHLMGYLADKILGPVLARCREKNNPLTAHGRIRGWFSLSQRNVYLLTLVYLCW